MKTNFHKSTGQGNLFSKLAHKIFENNTCVISRLQSRSLTGRNPQIKVHKHFSDRLQLIWQAKTNEMVTTRLINQNNIEIKKFCKELERGSLENLCNCVSLNFFFRATRDGKIETCLYVYGLDRDWLF
jgi:hypothetical protein